MKRFIKVIAAVAFAALTLSSCTKDEDNKTAPTPPSVETLTMGLPSLTVTKSDAVDEYYTFATTQVLYYWNQILQKIANIPIEGYRRVISVSPVYCGDDIWEWSTTYQDNFVTIEVKLQAEVNKKDVAWNLYVTKDGFGGYDEFCWITGWTSKDGRAGEWSVKAGPSNTTVLVKSVWASKDDQVDHAVLSYELDHKGLIPFANGSFIEYKASATDNAYDKSILAHYDQYGLGFWDVNIEWNSKSSAGRIMCSSKWSDGQWRYWNELHKDCSK